MYRDSPVSAVSISAVFDLVRFTVMEVLGVGVMEGEEDLMAEAEVMVVVAVETAETEVLWLW